MFVLGLVLLVWGSSLFVDSAVALANHLRLPEVLIGATIVSLGTTLPEVLFSAMASIQGLSDMAVGNAMGSILCNTGLIAGLLLLIRPVELGRREVRNVALGSVFLGIGLFVYTFGGIKNGGLTRAAGAELLLFCILYAAVSASQERGDSEGQTGQKFGVSDGIRLGLEAVAVYLGASLLVEHGPKLAKVLGVPEVVISLTFVALGTSLPELVTSLVALRKRHSSLSLGNIIGADVLNFLLVGGLSAAICPIPYPASIQRLELPFLFFLLAVLCLPSILRKKAGRLQGLLLLCGYALYLLLMGF